MNIEGMLSRLMPNDDHYISFEPGKLGRVDRFVLVKAGPEYRTEVGSFSTQGGEETASVLRRLDDLLETDPTFVVHYNNASKPQYAYCLWRRDDSPSRREPLAKMLPIYRRRLADREKIFSGKIKRGHKDFGFYPLEGYI
jgi:hypothetical protein